ncbi:hypothetical protein EJB05_00474, partial [Eragrostis curvula]
MVGTAGGVAEAAVRRWVEAGGGRLVLDGGLATELEANGADLNDPLWSAKCLLASPHLIRKASTPFPANSAATVQGFESKGFSKEQSENLLTKSVEIAKEARDVFLEEHSNQSTSIHHPILVAASIGSYGAYLADGSEYSGDYGEAGTLEFLKDFHRRRLQVLAEAGPDLIAFETIPNKLEAQAYAELLEECNINIPAWFSFNSKDGVNIVSGDSLIECATIADKCGKVTDKPILIYPNSGERYDGEKKEWVESTGVSEGDFVSYVSEWRKDGAALIGGCCRTTPNTIRAILENLERTRQGLVNAQHSPGIVELAAVIRRREHGHELSIGEELVPILHDLVRPADEVQVMFLKKLGDLVRPKRAGHSPLARTPSCNSFSRIRPEQIAQEAMVGHVDWSLNAANLIETFQVGGQSAVHAEDALADKRRDGEAVEAVGEGLP